MHCCHFVTLGIGPVKAASLIKQHKSIDKIVEAIKREGKVSYQHHNNRSTVLCYRRGTSYQRIGVTR